MRTKILMAVAAVATILTAASAMAFESIVDSKHNLAQRANSSTTQVCIYCHTPHNASKDIKAPLWNRNLPVGSTFILYSSSTARNRVIKSGLPDNSPSLACLSCHDGSNPGGRVINTATGELITVDGFEVGSKAAFTTDLSNHHPIGVPIDWNNGIVNPVTGEPLLRGKIAAQMQGVRFPITGREIEGGEDGTGVECTSCHNPHNNTYAPFLRITQDGSQLCLACHIK